MLLVELFLLFPDLVNIDPDSYSMAWEGPENFLPFLRIPGPLFPKPLVALTPTHNGKSRKFNAVSTAPRIRIHLG